MASAKVLRESHKEFPNLKNRGLYASAIRGDGNCLFNALSDQLYGHQDNHFQIRTATIEYMRANPNDFKSFIAVSPSGGQRRNPKRRTAANYNNSHATRSSNEIPEAPSAEDIDRTFEQHLITMARDGVWADNMEIVAFARAYGKSVKIWQPEYAYIVVSSDNGAVDPQHVVHIAYHSFEHYSSIRNLNGPFTGLPSIPVNALAPDEGEPIQDVRPARSPVPSWMVKQVSNCVHFDVSEEDIIRAVVETGTVDNAVDKLYELHQSQNPPPAHQSSSIEREMESDGDAANLSASGSGVNKRQPTQLNRKTKSARRIRESQKRLKLSERLSAPNNSLEILVTVTGGELRPVLPGRRNSIAATSSSDTDQISDSSVDPLKDGDTSSGSEYSLSVALSSFSNAAAAASALYRGEHEASPQPQTPRRGTPPISTGATPTGIIKKPARIAKEEKKRAQKLASKKRQQANAVVKIGERSANHAQISSGTMGQTDSESGMAKSVTVMAGNHHPVMASAIKTLYI